MRTRNGRWVVASLFVLPLMCASASAQDPAGPWTGSAGAGLAFTAGNTDTVNFNATYNVTYDPKTRNVVKSDALYLRAKTNGDLTVDNLGVKCPRPISDRAAHVRVRAGPISPGSIQG